MSYDESYTYCLSETDVEDLAWVAAVLNSGELCSRERADLAAVIRSKLPKPAMTRAEANALVRKALDQLDGTTLAAVSLVTGLSREQLDNLGGVDA